MRNNKCRIYTAIAILLLLCTVVHVTSCNREVNEGKLVFHCDAMYKELAENYRKSKDTKYLSEIVAYIDGAPVYMAEVVFVQKRAAVTVETMKCRGGSFNLETMTYEYDVYSQYIINEGKNISENYDLALEYIIKQRAIEKEAKRLNLAIDEKSINTTNYYLDGMAGCDNMDCIVQLYKGSAYADLAEEMLASYYKSKAEMFEALHVTEEQFYKTYEFSKNIASAYYVKLPCPEYNISDATESITTQREYVKELTKSIDFVLVKSKN